MKNCKQCFISPAHTPKGFCSQKCSAIYQFTGKSNPRWNNGMTTHEYGYILIKAPIDHPCKDKHGYIREHRLIMEKSIGRYLLPTEDIHHLNGIKTDNRIENLALISNRSEHLREEHRLGTYFNHLYKLNYLQ